MASIGQYESRVIGPIEDVSTFNLKTPTFSLRVRTSNIEDLAQSIKSVGLLQPLVVRNKKDSFEIVAGTRRYLACRLLGWRKVPCHIVELDDRSAYEVSMIENVQRHTLSPLEEGLAFRRYILELGWGGVTDLATKIHKSPAYVSKRINLLKLPPDILDLITQSEIRVTVAEELLGVDDSERQSELANIIHTKRLSLRASRRLINRKDVCLEDTCCLNPEFSPHLGLEDTERNMTALFDKSIIALKIAVKKLGSIIAAAEEYEQYWIYHDILMQHRNLLNSQIDLLIRQRKKSKRLLKRYFYH